MFPTETKILIVDDSSTMRHLILKQLSELSFTDIHQARDGAEAWQFLEEAHGKAPFQLIICDWNMPNISGIELLDRVRSHPDFSTVPFVMVTSDTESEKVAQAKRLKVDCYLTKPFTIVDLGAALTDVFKTVKKRAA